MMRAIRSNDWISTASSPPTSWAASRFLRVADLGDDVIRLRPRGCGLLVMARIDLMT